MEQEYQNAENAQNVCDLESAEMYLDWIIQTAPEPCFLASLLLIPFIEAWWITRRTRKQGGPA
jgi:hypothetical protein